ncbi:efflux RND transporter permease subunit [Pontibacter sp. SGAir0037]|uniref:efflux RND transporter permease subunit n=1 Tax=Pontibacter sp. SGAir0037 TaxID=2571030 RepID=UPI0010CCBECC|nr:efflux RND transporter permease subunit [Pontibacter sp. SGAir0037]QCR21249.1 multidrug transporter AcrB [Pontibacter sp. SGAir0037]
MNIFKLAIFRPVATIMVFLALMVFGVYSTLNLPVDLFPEIDPPIITVISTYQGAGALEVEQNVTRQLEDQFSTLNDLDEITSSSVDNLSIITIEFDWNANLDEASNNIRDALSRAQPLLPDDVDEPVIYRFNASSIPVITLAATAKESYPNLRQILDNQLVTPLNRIPGVGAVNIQGGPVREIQINIDPQRMRAYGVDINQISQALSNENLVIPAGDITVGRQQYNVRIDAEFKTVEEINQIVVRNTPQGGIIYVQDVAEVRDAINEENRLEVVNGGNAITISVQKQNNANTVEVAKQVLARLPELERTLPPDVKIQTVVDTSRYIVNSVNNLSEVLIYAVVFVVLVVFIFLRKWRATFIVALTIPFSLIGAFIYLSITGNTLNLISLSSLSIALGMVVDDAIVVLENITTYIERGTKPREAALYGTNEVGVAVVATTLTVVAVFLPLTFLTGMTGIWFGQLGAIVVVTIVISTLAALTLIPMMSSKLFKEKKKDNKLRNSFRHKLDRSVENVLGRMDRGYKNILGWSLTHKALVVVLAVVLFVGSLLLVPRIGTEFMPQADNARLMITLELPTGRSPQSALPTIEKVEAIFKEHVPELEIISSGIGSSTQGGGSIMGGASTGSNIIDINASLVPVDQRDRTVFEIAEVLREKFRDIPEIIDFSVSTQGGPSAGAPVAINIIGNDLEQISGIADRIVARLEQIEGVRNASVDRGDPQPALQIDLDRNRLAPLGLNTGAVGQSIRSMIAGQTATEYREQGEEFDVVVRYGAPFRQSIEDVRRMTITTPDGNLVEVGSLGEVREIFTPPNIERIGRERAVGVTADLLETPLNVVTAQMEDFIQNELDVPSGVEIEFGGDIEEQQDAFGDLFLLLGLSIILVYIVMAAQFESLKDPFIIMFSLPFAFTGVMLALVFTNTKLSVIAFVGGIILVGIVVKNAIVLVDYIQLLRGRGLSLFDSIVESGASRLRPVLMTTLTTLLAMVPLAISKGEGSETWKPMAVAVIGGLTFSTLITLVFVPVMYAIFHRKRKHKVSLLAG